MNNKNKVSKCTNTGISKDKTADVTISVINQYFTYITAQPPKLPKRNHLHNSITNILTSFSLLPTVTLTPYSQVFKHYVWKPYTTAN